MSPERWKRVEEVDYAALEREPGQRANFLADACGEDHAFRSEVESLLRRTDSSETLLDQCMGCSRAEQKAWGDSRRAILEEVSGFRLIDTVNGRSKVLLSLAPLATPVPPVFLRDRTLYFTGLSVASDVWVATRKYEGQNSLRRGCARAGDKRSPYSTIACMTAFSKSRST